MAELIKPIFVNISIIVSITFIANMLFPFTYRGSITLKEKVYFGVLSSIAALLCMAYPIEVLRSTVFDLRTVPLLIVTLYAGIIPGGICAFFIIMARLSIGGEFAWVGVLITIVALLTSLGYSKMFKDAHKKWKPGFLAIFLYFLFYILILNIYIDFLSMQFYVAYFVPLVITFFLMLTLIDRLLRINMQLEETIYLGKLSILGEMAASIAHEIRNPLTTVRGMIQFLSTDTKDKQLKQYAPLLVDELDRSNKIISDYLALVKPNELTLNEINLKRVVEDTISLLAPLGVYHNVVIQSKLKAHHFVKADEQHLKQCLINLIKNAIEAIEGGGQIVIKEKVTTPGHIDLLIEDNGKGMTNEELEKIGLPFYTTKTKGTGLGTMITYKLIKNMKGSIYYKSLPNKGTTVTVRIPLI
ncbi:ATP-binding protein [Pseudalkalibacillus sp. Hm43]|uniref:ATP-binding protein n=1 Tax=Pseudalkalibacillus sp. Hm43 TaxID=3450742 RepID=UPI003F42FC00